MPHEWRLTRRYPAIVFAIVAVTAVVVVGVFLWGIAPLPTILPNGSSVAIDHPTGVFYTGGVNFTIPENHDVFGIGVGTSAGSLCLTGSVAASAEFQILLNGNGQMYISGSYGAGVIVPIGPALGAGCTIAPLSSGSYSLEFLSASSGVNVTIYSTVAVDTGNGQ